MATWAVPEPYVGLELVDLPLAYRPACGPMVAFRLNYRQLGAVVEDPVIFSVGPNWSCSFRACVIAPNWSSGSAMLHRGGAGWIDYQAGVPQPRDGSLITSLAGGGFQISRRDGSVETYTTQLEVSSNNPVLFITTSTDPAGNSLTYNYYTTNSVQRLGSVTDADGRSTQLFYGNAAFPNHITQVVDPFSRTNLLAYDADGYLTNITDVAGLSSSFAYDSGDYRDWIKNLTTPYGSTGFQYGGDEYTTNGTGVDAYTLVTLPTGGHHLYMYRSSSSWLSSWNPTPPNTSPFSNTFEQQSDGFFPTDNTFYWGPLQYAALSTTNPYGLSTSDYSLSRMRHWLDNGGVSAAISLECAPSPDGTTPGEITWYDYQGKSFSFLEGASDFPSFVAKLLSDGSTTFTYSLPGEYLRVTNEVSTFSEPDGSVGLRTNEFIYAANGIDLLQWVGPNAEQVVSNYFAPGNTIHQPDAIFDALNEGTYYIYNSCGQVTSVQTPAGLTTTNIYYTSGASANLLSTTIDLQITRTNAYTYYANGLVETKTDNRGLTTTYTWDNLQRLTGVSYPDSTTTSNAYTYLDLTGMKDRLGNWDNFGYNAIRQRIAETNANSVVTAYNYCQCGPLFAVTNAWNTAVQMVTSFDYDYQGNRLHTYFPDATVTNYYDALGRVITTCDGWGCRWFGYNNQGLLTGVTNNAGVEQETVFDIEDRPVYVTDANGLTITNSYDLLGRLSTHTYPDGGIEQFQYAPAGLVAYINQLGFTNLYGYDAAMRKIVETNADGQILLYTNNAAGDLLSLTDGKGQTTHWGYDQYGRVTNKLDQAGTQILTYQYDADSRLSQRWSAAKGATTYQYDNLGNLLKVAYPVSFQPTFGYDALNRLTNMFDVTGSTSYSYTSGGFLATEDGPFASGTVTSTYLNRLRTGLSLAQPSGAWTNGFFYDSIERLSSVVSPAGTFDYYYPASLPSRLVQELVLPNTSYVTNTYDNNARLLATVLNNSSGTALDAASYGYNAGNQRTNFVNAAGTNVSYTYDPIGQLKAAASSVSSENRGYAYDAAWNLATRTNNGVSTNFGVNGLNELTNMASTTFHFDANGNLTNRTTGSTVIGYSYDDENRLASVESQVGALLSPTLTTFVYDGLGRLREQLQWTNSSGGGGGGSSSSPPPPSGGGGGSWGLSGGIHYVYDGKRVIQERNTGNTPTVSYTRGLDLSGSLEGAGGIGGLLARSSGYSSSGGTWSTHDYYHADGNGNITYLVNSAQTLAAGYRYDPYGNLLTSSGSLAGSNTYRFSSKEFIPTAGLYYYLYRFYDPSLQRWLNRDPIGEIDGPNLYTTLANSPVSRYDPVGLANSPKPSNNPCSCPCGAPGIDQGDAGGVVCCGGKAYACVWDPSGPTGTAKGKAKAIIAKCILKHEDTHLGSTVCPPSGGPTRGYPPPGVSNKLGECAAYKAEMTCLKSSIGQCDGDPQCIGEVIADMKDVKGKINANCP
jgi:RHS repeat-associated protein